MLALPARPERSGERIARLLDATEMINQNVVESGDGTIENDCWEFRANLMRKLEAELAA